MNFTNANCVLAGNCLGIRNFNFNEQIYFTLARLDYKVTDKIRVFAAYQYNYDRQSGTAFPNADAGNHLLNSSAGTPVDAFNGGIGNIAPNNLFTTGADIVLTSNIVATTRFGHAYQNYADRGLPNGDRYTLTVNTPTAAQSPTNPTQSLTGGLLEKAYAPISGLASGYANIAANLGYGYNINTRTTFNQDIAYFKKGFFGTHNFKFGYQLNHLYENVNQTFTNDLVRLTYGVGNVYAPGTTLGASNCAAIAASNKTNYGVSGGSSSGCQGLWGYVNLRDGTEVTGTASSNNHSFYARTPGKSPRASRPMSVFVSRRNISRRTTNTLQASASGSATRSRLVSAPHGMSSKRQDEGLRKLRRLLRPYAPQPRHRLLRWQLLARLRLCPRRRRLQQPTP